MNIKMRIIIFSVYQNEKSELINKLNHKHIGNELKSRGISFKELVGVYKGIHEQSYLVHESNRSLVEELCIRYNQECYLESNGDRSTELVYRYERKNIGILKLVSKEFAESKEAYTYDPINDSFWVTI